MQVVLSLLLNLLLGGASVIWWSGAASGRAAVVFRSGSQRVSTVRDAPGFIACERAELDPTKLEEWGCKMFYKVCFDQVRCTSAAICRRPALASAGNAISMQWRDYLPAAVLCPPNSPSRTTCWCTVARKPPTIPISHMSRFSAHTPCPPMCFLDTRSR